jgi:hypothetical protein
VSISIQIIVALIVNSGVNARNRIARCNNSPYSSIPMHNVSLLIITLTFRR